MPVRLSNPPTRRQAVADLADLLSDLVSRDRCTLVGFDFAFGYPAGFAGRLRPEAPTWKSVWKDIKARIRDHEDNSNNRFKVAAALNRQISGGPFPFWGCPKSAIRPGLSDTKPDVDDFGTMAEFRMTEKVASGPQPVWKLHYPGSVGSQTLTGIPCLDSLRTHPWLAGAVKIWPFETGLNQLTRPTENGWRLLFAEVYPSMIPVELKTGEIKDVAQVRALGQHFANLDDRGELAPLFAGPSTLSAEDRHIAETEEGWILGIETAARPPSHGAAGKSKYMYVRDPRDIYRRSFAAIRSEINLELFPKDIEPLVVRLIHACGMPDIVDDLAFHPKLAGVVTEALRSGAPILVDAKMVADGIIPDRLPADNKIICTLHAPVVPHAAEANGTTRSAAAVDLWRPHLAGAVVAVGNAPTALFRLLELIDEGAEPPAAVLAFPVGFVGAAESKEALIDHQAGIPYVTLRGRRGGSALAAAAVNALTGGAS
jgi:precorrin-8X/cobalt-precorrin-8 methylmutase